MSNNNSVPGLMFPTQKGMLSGNPRDSAMQSMNNNAELQAQANNSLSGGRLRKRKAYGGGNTLAVSQFTMPYPETSGPGTGVNSQVKGISQTSTQMAANSALDAGVTTMGGSKRSVSRRRSRRRSRRGGNPDWLWGCMSGGKKCSRKAYGKRRTRKSRKSRKY
jgi:hypothetical protein